MMVYFKVVILVPMGQLDQKEGLLEIIGDMMVLLSLVLGGFIWPYMIFKL